MSALEDPAASVQIESGWKEALRAEFGKPYFQELKSFLIAEKKAGQVIYPPGPLIFNAFNATPFKSVNVVILGQDPYHGPGQAHGLCFSVQHGVKPPPSLKNMYKELNADVGFVTPTHGNLESWAGQGVLLLNSLLTVRARQAGSHKGKGWETFTDAAIKAVNDHREGVIFLLWGRYAQNKGEIIDPQKHVVLKAAHPSPFSAHSGYFGCGHFSKTNELLQRQGKKTINWQV